MGTSIRYLERKFDSKQRLRENSTSDHANAIGSHLEFQPNIRQSSLINSECHAVCNKPLENSEPQDSHCFYNDKFPRYFVLNESNAVWMKRWERRAVLAEASEGKKAQDLNNNPVLWAQFQRIQKGSRKALEEFYRATVARVFSFVRRFVKTSDDVEDIVSETYTYLWFKSTNYDKTKSSLIGWLLLIARSKAIDFIRKETKHKKKSQAFETTEQVSHCAKSDVTCEVSFGGSANVFHPEEGGSDSRRESYDSSLFMASPDFAFQCERRGGYLQVAIKKLNFNQRQLIYLSFYRGFTHQQLSHTMNIPIGTVKSQLRYAMNALSTIVKERSVFNEN